MPTIEKLVIELNLVAEYASVEAPFEAAGPSTVSAWGETFEVDVPWAMGNTKRLPDRTSSAQMREALVQSHPKVKGLGPKHPPKG
jgi:hypothetical protein